MHGYLEKKNAATFNVDVDTGLPQTVTLVERVYGKYDAYESPSICQE